jgi:hypothetical protein
MFQLIGEAEFVSHTLRVCSWCPEILDDSENEHAKTAQQAESSDHHTKPNKWREMPLLMLLGRRPNHRRWHSGIILLDLCSSVRNPTLPIGVTAAGPISPLQYANREKSHHCTTNRGQ